MASTVHGAPPSHHQPPPFSRSSSHRPGHSFSSVAVGSFDNSALAQPIASTPLASPPPSRSQMSFNMSQSSQNGGMIMHQEPYRGYGSSNGNMQPQGPQEPQIYTVSSFVLLAGSEIELIW